VSPFSRHLVAPLAVTLKTYHLPEQASSFLRCRAGHPVEHYLLLKRSLRFRSSSSTRARNWVQSSSWNCWTPRARWRSGEWLRRNGLYCLSSPMVEGLWQRRAKKQPSSKWMCVFSLQQPLNHLTRAQLRNTTVGDKRMPPTQSPIQIRQNVSEWTINHLLSFHFMHLIKPMISVCLPVCLSVVCIHQLKEMSHFLIWPIGGAVGASSNCKARNLYVWTRVYSSSDPLHTCRRPCFGPRAVLKLVHFQETNAGALCSRWGAKQSYCSEQTRVPNGHCAHTS